MAASPMAVDSTVNNQPLEKWTSTVEVPPHLQPPATKGDDHTNGNGAAHHPDEHHVAQQPEDGTSSVRNASAQPESEATSPSKQDASQRGEKQIKPNKVYIGGLPEATRKEDLDACFGKIGKIVNVELKVGYGFVEFETREAAEESVAKYNEGHFMGNKIRVELSHGGGRTAKYSNDPGACFKCGQVGHWARECPNSTSSDSRRSGAPLIDRIQPPRDYPPPPPRDYPPYEYSRYPPPRDTRYGYDYPPPPSRDYRRPPSPPRDYRDYPPPPAARGREPDDTRRGPPSRYESRPGYYPDADVPPSGYSSRYAAPPRDYYDRYDRRAPPPGDRYAPYPPPPTRARSPPPRSRDDFERPPARDYPPPAEYRGRPPSPPASRFADYPSRGGSAEPSRFRRRSQSPPVRSAAGYDSYAPSSAGPPYGGSSSGYANGYTGGPPARGSARDYPPPRSRDADSGYRRP